MKRVITIILFVVVFEWKNCIIAIQLEPEK